MKRMLGILALVVIASIMIAGCVQPGGNETPAATETPAETPMGAAMETMVETPTETMMETPMATGTPTESPMETPTETMTETPTATGAPAAVTADEIVSITDSGFVPETLTVPAGTTVGWVNDASTNQTVSPTGPTGFFESGLLEPGDNYTYTFNSPDNHTYQSQTSGLTGTIIVTMNTTNTTT